MTTTPHFKAINAATLPSSSAASPSRHSTPCSTASEELPSPRHFITIRSAACKQQEPAQDKEPTEYPPDKEWDVQGLAGKREGKGGIEYLTRWASCVLPRKDVRRRQDGTQYVRCAGTDCDVVECSSVSPAENDGMPQCNVEWADSWKARELLSEESIEEYEDLWREGPEAGSPSREEASVAANGELRGAQACNEHFVPEKGFNYSHSVRSWLLAKKKRLIGSWVAMLQARPVRQLTFRPSFIEAESEINLTSNACRNAALLYDTGYEQHTPCDYCSRGLGPFPKCVVGNIARGACANCAYSCDYKGCNFHEEPRPALLSREAVRQVSTITRISQRAHTSSPGPSSNLTSASDGGKTSSASGYHSEETQLSSPPPASSPPNYRGPSPELGEPFSPRIFPKRPRPESQHALRTLSSFQPSNTSVLKALSPSQTNARSRLITQLSPSQPSHRISAMDHHSSIVARKRRHPDGADQARPSTKDRDSEPSRSSLATPIVTSGLKRKRSAASVPRGVEQTRDARTEQARLALQCEDHSERVVAGPSSQAALVCSDQHFGMRQATDAEVKFIISHCDDDRVKFFEKAWQHWKQDRVASGKSNRYGKETYLSMAFHERLNEAVSSCCPRRGGEAPHNDGLSRADPIVLDD